MIAIPSLAVPEPDGPETFHFSCPCCARPYHIRYDPAARKIYDGRYDDFTCFIKEAPCGYCQNLLYLVYDAEHLCVAAYDSSAENRRRRLAERIERKRLQLMKIRERYRKEGTAELREKKNRLRRKLNRLEDKKAHRDAQYAEERRRATLARRLAESIPF